VTTLTRWDPFRELTTLRDEVNRMFSRSLSEGGGRPAGTWSPPIDVFDTADAIVLKAELPGLKPEDVEVEVDEGVLSIRGERRFTEQVEEGRYHRLERAYGQFARSLSLPTGVRSEDITATFTDGVLEVRVPKADEVRPRKIAVAAQT
jgi:HSP20 family protein